MKTKFYVTKSAGRDVAGQASPGAGNSIMLTESQAAHALRVGHLSRNPISATSTGAPGPRPARRKRS